MSEPQNKPIPKSRFFPAILLILLSAIITLYWGNTYLNSKASSSWPTTKGTITYSEISMRSRSGGPRFFHAHIEYSYNVRDTYYQGNRISYGYHGTSSKSKAHNLVKKYPKDAVVDIYFSPQNPENSVLEIQVKQGNWTILAAGGLLLVMGITFLAKRKITQNKMTR